MLSFSPPCLPCTPWAWPKNVKDEANLRTQKLSQYLEQKQTFALCQKNAPGPNTEQDQIEKSEKEQPAPQPSPSLHLFLHHCYRRLPWSLMTISIMMMVIKRREAINNRLRWILHLLQTALDECTLQISNKILNFACFGDFSWLYFGSIWRKICNETESGKVRLIKLDLPLPITSTSRELMIDRKIRADWHRQLSEACVRKWKWINGPFHTFFHEYILVGLISKNIKHIKMFHSWTSTPPHPHSAVTAKNIRFGHWRQWWW